MLESTQLEYNDVTPLHFHIQFSSVQLLSCVRLFATPWIAACQASLSITNSRISLKFKSIESVMPSSHLILCHPLHLLLPIPPSIRVFSNESTLHMRWPKYWSFSFSIIPSKEHSGPISFRMDWLGSGKIVSFESKTCYKENALGAFPSVFILLLLEVRKFSPIFAVKGTW